MAKFHFLFEQSGTFKNAAIKLGHTAYDYDIVKTDDVDFQVDLIKQITSCGTDLLANIFDDLDENDIVFAFFPCSLLPPLPSLWVVPVHQPQASSTVYRTWTGDSFHT